MAGPNATLDVSPAGLALIASFEGWRAGLYDDVAGHATIGYGHLVHTGPVTAADRAGPYGKGITKEQGMALLHQDAQRMVQAVRNAVTVPLDQQQFDALVSFAYNVGAGAFAGSTLVRLLNQGDYEGAANAFGAWTKAGGKVVAGLVRRRAEEAALFRGSGPAPKPAPSPGGGSWCTRVLSKGMRGDDVRELQRRLGLPADGIFGAATEAAVRQAQQRHGLTADGKVGPRTAAVL